MAESLGSTTYRMSLAGKEAGQNNSGVPLTMHEIMAETNLIFQIRATNTLKLL